MDQQQAYGRLAFDYGYGQMAAWFAEPHALLVSDWLPATVLWYTQWVGGRMPTAQVLVVDPLEGQWVRPASEALESGRPVYLARPLMAAGDRYSLTSAGPLVRVRDAPLTTRPLMSHTEVDGRAEAGAVFRDEIKSLGSDLVVTAPGAEGAVYAFSDIDAMPLVQGGSTLHVVLYWQALRPPTGDYRVKVRLVDSAGNSWLERYNRHPVGGAYPTSRWQAGEVVGDYYELALPPYLPSGTYQVRASMADMARDLLVKPLFVRKPLRWQRPILGTAVRRLFGSGWGLVSGLVLVGYDAPHELVPGETVSIALQWLVCGDTPRRVASSGQLMSDNDRPRLVLVSRDGAERSLTPYVGLSHGLRQSVGSSQSDELDRSKGLNRLDDWRPGALVVDPYTFTVPSDVDHIEVQSARRGRGLFGFDRFAANRVFRQNVDRYRLPLRVASESPPGVNLGNVVRLRSYAYEAASFRAGEIVHLTLEWEAIDTMDEAYKVFVHVLGPNGLPIAQQDNEPVNGTYPTTRWQAGERVSDAYAIRLPDDLPPGEYPVEVGLYRISDLSRLPVLDQNRAIADDKVFLTPLTVK
jgi:hypothetical protein